MSLPSVELTALLVSNQRLTSAVVACCVAIGLLVGACCYLAYRSNRIRYTTVSSGVTLSLPGELDEQTLRNFAETVVSRLGNVTPESIESTSRWVLRRAEPSVRVAFELWLKQQSERIQVEDIVVHTANPQVVAMQKVSRMGTPVYDLVVRARQTLWIASQPLGPRTIDVPMRITVGPIGNALDLVVQAIAFPNLFTLDGAVMDVTKG
jgi:hypothetical protein